MNILPASLSVVSVVNAGDRPQVALARLADALSGQVGDFDIVLIANGVDAETALVVKTLVERLPDSMAVFLGTPVADDLARLVGVEHAVGDHVLFCHGTDAELGALPALLAKLHEGYDMVRCDPPEEASRGLHSRLLMGSFTAIHSAMTGLELEPQAGGMRALSRAAALFVAAQPNAELLLRARGIGASFPATAIAMPASPPGEGASARRVWARGFGLLLGVSATALRTASYVAMGGGVLSVAYALYVVAIFLFKADVAAGWTTISLQLAALMFMFSLMFLFLTEYVIQIHAANPPRSRRQMVVRELRSPLSRHAGRLNVVDAGGRFALGAPDGA